MNKVLTSIALLSLLSINSAQATPSSYVLMCKGGGNMSIKYNSSTNKLVVNFHGGSRAGNNGVAAGSCTWVDRGFRSSEPRKLCQLGVNDVVFQMNGSDKVTSISSSKAPYIKKILRGDTFQVRVYNDGAGCMKVTRPGV